MIGSLRGILSHKAPGEVLLDVQGVGYEIHTPVGFFERLPDVGEELQLFIVESMAMYGGGITLYGFQSLDEKQIYLLLREVPGTGSKKALDYLDKIAKAMPDFRRAILESDTRVLMSIFGFTKKTADKMVVALKERMAGLRVSGREKLAGVPGNEGVTEALAALIQLGYRETEARSALDRLPADIRSGASTTELVKEALKQIA
jgi:Holliday junction DNA helicase RuvA